MKYENIARCQFSSRSIIPMHFHQDIEIMYVLEGNVDVIFEDGSTRLNKDDFLLINSNVRHSGKGNEDVLVGSILIDYAMLTEIFGGEQLSFRCNSAEEEMGSYDRMRSYIHQIFNYYQSSEGQGVLLKNTVYYQLLYLITSEFIIKKGAGKYGPGRNVKDDRLEDIYAYLTANYREQLTLKALADRLYLSVPYLSKYIKKNFGTSFLKLLNNIRLDKAVSELLYTDKTILKIAMDNGFPNLAGFNHAFRENYQMSPTEYRLEMQKKIKAVEEPDNEEELMERVDNYLSDNQVTVPQPEEITQSVLEINANAHTELKQNWFRLINAGNACDILNYKVREQLMDLKRNLNFEYVRLWNLFTPSMMVYLDEKKTRYNFSYIDQVFDFLRDIKVKPHIELAWKEDGVFRSVEQAILRSKHRNKSFLLESNEEFLREFITHVVSRYGRPEVAQWYFELEKNSVVDEGVTTQRYLDIFDKVAGIFRACLPDIRIGGAGFTMIRKDSDMKDVLQAWAKRKQHPDFISIYSFPYLKDEELLDAGRNPYSADEDFLFHKIQYAKEIMKECGLEDTPLIVSEWSMTLSNRNCLNDGSFKAAYVMNNLLQNMNEADAIGYWMASDVYTEGLDSDALLFGGCGLMTKHGIHKPVYYTYDTLARSLHRFYARNKYAVVTGNGADLYFICCHNYKHFNFRYYSVNEDAITVEQQNRYLEDQEHLHLTLRFNSINNGRYLIKIFRVDREHGNVQCEWQKMKCLENPAALEINYLKNTCQPNLSIFYAEAQNRTLELDIQLTPLEIQGIVVAGVE